MTLKSKLDALNPRVKELEAIVEKQSQMIEGLRRARYSIPVGRRKGKGKTFLRVIIPDTHGAHLDKGAARAFLNDLEILKPAEVVHLGDALDCGGFLAQHFTLGFVPECEYTFEDDVAAANEFLDQVQKRVGRAEFDLIEGNHELRVAKWIIKQTLRNRRDSGYLYRMFGPANVMGLEKRGIRFIERGKQYDGVSQRGTIKRGKCYFKHGTRCGVYAAKQALEDMGGNIVTGHTHRISSFAKETASSVIGSWQVGCLCELNPLYGDSKPSNWAHGYGVQCVNKDGSFMHITVPVISGRSYLSNLIGGV